MIKRLLVITVICLGFSVLQSTLFIQILPFGFVPDFSLIFLLAFSWHYGSLLGSIAGFIVGLHVDFLSLAPMGFHSLLFTITGYLYGRLQDNIAPDIALLPMLAALIAAALKYGGAVLLDLVFALNLGMAEAFSLTTLWEILADILVAPLVFFLSRYVWQLIDAKKGGF